MTLEAMNTNRETLAKAYRLLSDAASALVFSVPRGDGCAHCGHSDNEHPELVDSNKALTYAREAITTLEQLDLVIS